MVNGYIVEAREGFCLTRFFEWYTYSRLEGAWVHEGTLEQVQAVLSREAPGWTIKPWRLHPAIYDAHRSQR